MRAIRRVIGAATLYDIDRLTARRWAQLKGALATAGTPIPDNDLWIAAVAVQHGLTLVTHDAHFSRVKGLSVQIWPR